MLIDPIKFNVNIDNYFLGHKETEPDRESILSSFKPDNGNCP